MREIEIKLRINNLEELEKKLIDTGLVISKEVVQRDTVYVSNGMFDGFANVKVGDTFIRIRNENGINSLTLKQQRGLGLDKTEYETKIEDGEAMHQILLLLEWKPVVEVNKKRKKGKLGEYEICLDSVEDLGNFIELEKMTDDNVDPEKVKTELFEALKPFGLTKDDEETKGYDILMYQLKNK